MLRVLTLIPLLLRVRVQSTTNDTTSPIWDTLPPNGTVPGTAQSVSYQWIAFAAAEQSMYNVSMELMFGSAEGGGNDVMDIMQIQMQQSGTYSYYFRPSTPPGNYHVRLNGTVWSLHEATPTSINDLVLNAPLFNATTRTPTFSVAAAASSAFPCAMPAFTPVPNLSDPAYAPVRVAGPTEGSVVSLQQNSTSVGIEGWNGLLDANFYPMDTFTYYEVWRTLLRRRASDGGAREPRHRCLRGSHLRSKLFEDTFSALDGIESLNVNNLTVSPGAWVIRANYTWITGSNVSTLSPVFNFASALPCVGIGNDTSAARTAASATAHASPTAHGGTSGSLLLYSADWRANVWVFVLIIGSALVV
ncbi:hypothetical protein B0H16DRAFT_1526590 [Mycena metata]|uniref:Uncharacterized protein n=1 Tax=Mycena metata TaxID=1033252 RepID=A0AAD7NK56_9AGAR|nr:hypothetical protein B0H16DRAFT_1526590 [Mycena metata]